MANLIQFANLVKAFELLALDNNMTMHPEIVVPRDWLDRFETANSQAGYLDAKTLGVFLDCKQFTHEEASDDDNALAYLVNGEQTIVAVLVKEARVQTLHEVLNAAFDGDLHDAIFETGRARHVR